MNRRDIIFLGILFLIIIIIGMIYIDYVFNIIEGFPQSYVDNIHDTITGPSGNTLTTYILDTSNNPQLKANVSSEIMKFISEIDTNVLPIYDKCQNQNCTGVPHANLQIIQNIIDPSYGTLTNYINNSTDITNKNSLITPLTAAYPNILEAQKNCTNNLCD